MDKLVFDLKIPISQNLDVAIKEPMVQRPTYTIFNTSNPSVMAKILNPNVANTSNNFSNETSAYRAMKPSEYILKCLDSGTIKKSALDLKVIFLEKCLQPSRLYEIAAKSNDLNSKDVIHYTIEDEIEICKLLKDSLLALHHIHSSVPAFSYRNFSLDNYFVDGKGTYKLADLSQVLFYGSQKVDANFKEQVRKYWEKKDLHEMFISPEEINFKSEYGEKTDIWALGCFAIWLISSKNLNKDNDLIHDSKPVQLPKVMAKLDDEIIKLLMLMVEKKAEKRPSVGTLIALLDNIIKKKLKLANAEREEGKTDSKGSPTLLKKRSLSSTDLVRNMKGPDEKPDPKKEKIPGALINSKQSGKDSHHSSQIHSTMSYRFTMMVKRMTSDTEGWILSVLEEQEEAPNEEYIYLLLSKAWNKREKVSKFYKILSAKIKDFANHSVVALKSCYLLHRYLREGPSDCYHPKDVPKKATPWEILVAIKVGWEKAKYEDVEDKARNEYVVHLIVSYAALLMKKVDFIDKYSTLFNGTFAVLISRRESGMIEIKPPTFYDDLVGDFISCLQKYINLLELLQYSLNLPSIQRVITLVVIEDLKDLLSISIHFLLFSIALQNSRSIKYKKIHDYEKYHEISEILQKYLILSSEVKANEAVSDAFTTKTRRSLLFEDDEVVRTLETLDVATLVLDPNMSSIQALKKIFDLKISGLDIRVMDYNKWTNKEITAGSTKDPKNKPIERKKSSTMDDSKNRSRSEKKLTEQKEDERAENLSSWLYMAHSISQQQSLLLKEQAHKPEANPPKANTPSKHLIEENNFASNMFGKHDENSPSSDQNKVRPQVQETKDLLASPKTKNVSLAPERPPRSSKEGLEPETENNGFRQEGSPHDFTKKEEPLTSFIVDAIHKDFEVGPLNIQETPPQGGAHNHTVPNRGGPHQIGKQLSVDVNMDVPDEPQATLVESYRSLGVRSNGENKSRQSSRESFHNLADSMTMKLKKCIEDDGEMFPRSTSKDLPEALGQSQAIPLNRMSNSAGLQSKLKNSDEKIAESQVIEERDESIVESQILENPPEHEENENDITQKEEVPKRDLENWVKFDSLQDSFSISKSSHVMINLKSEENASKGLNSTGNEVYRSFINL